MPHLRFRAIDFDTVKALSTELVDELQPLMDCPREDFTLEHIPASLSLMETFLKLIHLLRCFGSIEVKRPKIA
ncbi:Domain of uncharacterised function (DUF1904) [Photobacterium damselae]|nr:Domain of uncharacterised function (DUF1904) [Photobacterium damselae]